MEEVITELKQFIKWIGQFKGGEYLFRGVSNTCHEIEASAYRRLEKKEKKPENLVEISLELINEAKLQGHNQRNGQELSDLELLAELQHFGAATCLIDFTRNALVALWFGCQKELPSKEKNGRVFVVRSDGLEPLTKVNYKTSQWDIKDFFKPDATAIYPLYQWSPKHLNNRIIAQQSVFIFGRAPIEIANTCQIKTDSKEKILTELEELSGITGASLFPDFDGFAWLRSQDKPRIESTIKAYRIRGLEVLQENLEKAIDDFTESIGENTEIDQENVDSYYHRARAYRRKGELDNAINDCDKVIDYYKGEINSDKNLADKLNPKLAQAYNVRGIAYWAQGEYDTAIENYTKALERDQKFAKAYSNRGDAYADKSEYDTAIENYTKALERRPDYVHVYSNRGEAWLHKQEWDKARTDLTKAEEMDVNIIESFQMDYKDVEDFKKKIT